MTFRIVARLDVKPPNLVKGIHLEGFRRIGNPSKFALQYYRSGADELSYQDVVASLYGRNSIQDLVAATAQEVFIPITVGGGIKSVEDADTLIRSGADKISLNTAAVRNPLLITSLEKVFGRQAIVLNVEAKEFASGKYLVMTDSGREHSGIEVCDWVKEASGYGIGEILLTSVDSEGTRKGFDLNLLQNVREVTDLPIIMHGGAGELKDILLAAKNGADGVAVASILHFEVNNIIEIKQFLNDNQVEVRI
jgi:cyclase